MEMDFWEIITPAEAVKYLEEDRFLEMKSTWLGQVEPEQNLVFQDYRNLMVCAIQKKFQSGDANRLRWYTHQDSQTMSVLSVIESGRHSEFAETAGILQRELSLVENGRLIPCDFEKKRIADALKVTVGDITWAGECNGGVHIIPKDKDDPQPKDDSQEDTTVDQGFKNLGATIGKAISDHFLESQRR